MPLDVARLGQPPQWTIGAACVKDAMIAWAGADCVQKRPRDRRNRVLFTTQLPSISPTAG
jgi:hypothetical protein